MPWSGEGFSSSPSRRRTVVEKRSRSRGVSAGFCVVSGGISLLWFKRDGLHRAYSEVPASDAVVQEFVDGFCLELSHQSLAGRELAVLRLAHDEVVFNGHRLL